MVVAYVVDGEDVDVNRLNEVAQEDPESQHSEFKWLSADDPRDEDLRRETHRNTLVYFKRPDAPMSLQQYGMLNARRDAANQLVWQTPVVGLTGLAFLFTVLLRPDTPTVGRLVAAFLAVLIAFSVIQLNVKQRFTEETLSKEAEAFEIARGMHRLNRQRRHEDDAESDHWLDRPWIQRRIVQLQKYRSVDVWRVLFSLAGFVAVFSAVYLSLTD